MTVSWEELNAFRFRYPRLINNVFSVIKAVITIKMDIKIRTSLILFNLIIHYTKKNWAFRPFYVNTCEYIYLYSS